MDIDKFILKFIWRSKKSTIANAILKKNKIVGLTLPDFKTYDEAIVIKTVWVFMKKIDK